MEKVVLAERRRFSPEKMQKNSLIESDCLFYDLYCLEPGQQQNVHSHAASDKVYLTLEGRPTVQVGEESAVLEQGEAVVAPAGQDHGVSNPTEERAVLLVVMAPPPH
ncbi:MAG: cupin domain-containing protein [Armatimonadetes bacterium]|nr:cupin domain-containing protein [Armatimonadota bacterium]